MPHRRTLLASAAGVVHARRQVVVEQIPARE
jgi:hypothetical protein